jgi:hypothetical protein
MLSLSLPFGIKSFPYPSYASSIYSHIGKLSVNIKPSISRTGIIPAGLSYFTSSGNSLSK